MLDMDAKLMKKTLFIAFAVVLLTLSTSSAVTIFGRRGAGPPPTGLCDSCTGDKVLCWEMTAVDTDITNSGGCATTDTTATGTGSVELTAAPTGEDDYAIYSNASNEYYSFDTPDISAAGTIEFDLYVDTFVDEAMLVDFLGSTGVDELRIRLSGTDEMLVDFFGNSTEIYMFTDGANISTGAWYHITVKWREGTDNPSLYIAVDAYSTSVDNDLTAASDIWSTVDIGLMATTGAVHIKNLEIYDAYQ
jgi:hypothetical protein